MGILNKYVYFHITMKSIIVFKSQFLSLVSKIEIQELSLDMVRFIDIIQMQ